jgi:hypothetical protein
MPQSREECTTRPTMLRYSLYFLTQKCSYSPVSSPTVQMYAYVRKFKNVCAPKSKTPTLKQFPSCRRQFVFPLNLHCSIHLS